MKKTSEENKVFFTSSSRVNGKFFSTLKDAQRVKESDFAPCFSFRIPFISYYLKRVWCGLKVLKKRRGRSAHSVV